MKINEKEINAKIAELDSHKVVIERLGENPFYVKYKEISDIIQKGQHVERMIVNEKGVAKQLGMQVKAMIQQLKNPAPVAPAPAPVPKQPVAPQQPQQPAPVPEQQPAAVKEEEAVDETDNLFQAKKDDLGIDEEPDIDGLPDFEDEDENV